LVSAVETRILLLLDAGAVVVAAAGNDAFTYGYAPQPRIPADYEDVLCVAATDREGRRAGYSNHADIPLSGNCVATWGGQGVEWNGQAVVPIGPEPRDGMVGVAVEPTIVTPYGTVPNTTGWVYWSGTSFATPIISAIAANLLAENEYGLRAGLTHHRLTPRGVMARVLAMAGPTPDPAADPGAPYLKVSQQRY
jgi:subtilisin family serine protease